jgi:hypothetical protein
MRGDKSAKKSYPRLQNRPYLTSHHCSLVRAALMRRPEERAGRAGGAGDQASRTWGRTRATADGRWSAGRRSGSVAGLRKPSDHRPRAPRDGFRKPVLARRVGAPIARGAREASQASQGRRSAAPRRLPALHFPLRRDEEKGTGAAHAEPNNRAAERWLMLIASFRGARSASPESITTNKDVETQTE